MPSIKREDLDALNVELSVNIAQADYQSKFNSELSKYRKHASLKGFRKGKTPLSVIKKLYGRSILLDVVNGVLQEDLTKYLMDSEEHFLGQPIPSKKQEEFDFDPNKLQDFTFSFDIGLAPVFEWMPLNKKNSFDYLKVSTSKKDLKKELDAMRRQGGESVEVDAPVEEEDIITVKAVELDGKKAKKDGVENEFTLFVKNTTDKAKASFLGKKAGKKVTVDIFDLEKNTAKNMVRKYLLGLAEDDDREIGNNFQLTIEKVSRLELAELNEEFFEKLFPGAGISSEKDALEKIAETKAANSEKQCDALLFRDVQEKLMDKYDLPLPETFLKRWLLISNEDTTPEAVDQGYESFAKNLQWTLVREQLIKQFDVKVEEAEIKNAFRDEAGRYFGGNKPEWLTDDMLDNMVERMAAEKGSMERKHDEIVNDKLLLAVKEAVKLKDKKVSSEELNTIIEEINAKMEQEQQLAAGDEEE